MTTGPKIVLALPISDKAKLADFVEQCVARNVSLIALYGEGCEQIEHEIDMLVVGDGTDSRRFITTSTHPSETLEEVVEFATSWRVNADGPTEVVQL
jgi:hypothetical protein